MDVGLEQGRPSPFPLRPRTAYGLALLCGALSLLAFPAVGAWPVAFVSFVPLQLALHRQQPRRALLLGWTAAFAGKLGAFYWIVHALRTFGRLSLPVCVLALVLLCAYQAGRFGLHGWLTCRAAVRGWPMPLAFAAAFAASEQAYPLLFPWSFAASVHQVPALLQAAELGGPIAVGLVLVCANLALGELILARLERRRIQRALVSALAAVPVVATLLGLVRMAQVDARLARAPVARIGIVQANMAPGAKEEDPTEGLRRHVELTRRLQPGGPLDLVVWSEAALARLTPESRAADQFAATFAGRLGVPALFGAVLTRPVEDARRLVIFNSALLTDARGRIVDRYDKRHLLPFSEVLPFGQQIPALYRWVRGARGQSGAEARPLRAEPHQVAVFICYEDILPGYVNDIVRGGDPALLVNLTNDAWFGDTSEPWIHLALSRLRAVEHRRFFVRAANSGVSALIDPSGRLLVRTDVFTQAARRVEARWMTGGATAYEAWGDAPWWLAAGAAAIGAFTTRPRRGGRPV